MEKTFSILIPSWNNLPYLQLCIDSIHKNSRFKHQIIIHINEGTDGTLQFVQNTPSIEYTYSKENIGVCYALNTARSLVKTDYIVYLNDDMYLCPEWDLYLMNEIKEASSPLFFFSSTVIEAHASSNCVIEKNYGDSIENFKERELVNEYKNHPFKDWSGATWPPNIVPTFLWDLVGGYSIEFSPGMYSDPDFSMKLFKAGVRNFKGIAQSRAYHFGSKSVHRVKKNRGYYQFVNKWGYTSSLLTKHILKRGEKYVGLLSDQFKIKKYLQFKATINRFIANLYRESM